MGILINNFSNLNQVIFNKPSTSEAPQHFNTSYRLRLPENSIASPFPNP